MAIKAPFKVSEFYVPPHQFPSQYQVALSGTLFPASAGAGYVRTVTVDHTQVPSDQTNFTVLVSITDATLKTVANSGHVQRSDGFDINFYSDSAHTTILKWEMESYDGAAGTVVAWVKIASLSSSSDTVFYMFYGDPSITTDQSDKANTWDSNFAGIWHMNDNAATTTIVASVGSNATNAANTSGKTAVGQVGNALTYNGTSDASSVAINLSGINLITLSFWMKWTTNNNSDWLAFEFTSNYNSNNGFIVDWNAASGFFQFGYHNNAAGYLTDHFNRPSAGAWHLIHLVINRNNTVSDLNKGYVDGTLQTLTADTHTDNALSNFDNSTLYFMSRAASSLRGTGVLDEVRVSTAIERGADWVTCEFNNQKASSTFVSLGSETPLGGASTVTLLRQTLKALSAALSFIGDLATSFIGGGAHLFTQSYTATLSFVGGLTKNIIDSGFTATLSFVGATIKRLLDSGFTATLSFTGALSNRISKSAAATLSFVGAFTKKLLDSGFTATLSFVGAVTKRLLDSGFAATLSFTGLLAASKSFLKALTATLSFTGLLAASKSFLKAFTATLSFTGALVRRAGRAFAATLSFTAGLARRLLDSGFAATLSFVGGVTRKLLDSGFTATLSFVGSFSVSKSFLKAFTATLSFAGAVTTATVHFFTKSLTATLSLIGNLSRTRTVVRALTATLAFSGAISRRAAKSLTATLGFSSALRKGIGKKIGAVLSFIAAMFRGGVTIYAGQVTGGSPRIKTTGSSARITKAGSQLTIERTETIE